MENRRLQARGSIDKKLKRNQEFLMTSTLSPQTQMWTRWHQDRLINAEMDRDLSGAPNQKYISVSKYPQFASLRTFIPTEANRED